jgi:hypothetical protein
MPSQTDCRIWKEELGGHGIFSRPHSFLDVCTLIILVAKRSPHDSPRICVSARFYDPFQHTVTRIFARISRPKRRTAALNRDHAASDRLPLSVLCICTVEYTCEVEDFPMFERPLNILHDCTRFDHSSGIRLPKARTFTPALSPLSGILVPLTSPNCAVSLTLLHDHRRCNYHTLPLTLGNLITATLLQCMHAWQSTV